MVDRRGFIGALLTLPVLSRLKTSEPFGEYQPGDGAVHGVISSGPVVHYKGIQSLDGGGTFQDINMALRTAYPPRLFEHEHLVFRPRITDLRDKDLT